MKKLLLCSLKSTWPVQSADSCSDVLKPWPWHHAHWTKLIMSHSQKALYHTNCSHHSRQPFAKQIQCLIKHTIWNPHLKILSLHTHYMIHVLSTNHCFCFKKLKGNGPKNWHSYILKLFCKQSWGINKKIKVLLSLHLIQQKIK